MNQPEWAWIQREHLVLQPGGCQPCGELATKDEIKKAESEGDFEKMWELEKELPFIRKNLQADLEAKKEAVRQRKK